MPLTRQNTIVTVPGTQAWKGLERGIAPCGSGVGASECANKFLDVRAALMRETFSARQGVEDDHINIFCLGGRTVGPAVAWELWFLQAEFSGEDARLGGSPR